MRDPIMKDPKSGMNWEEYTLPGTPPGRGNVDEAYASRFSPKRGGVIGFFRNVYLSITGQKPQDYYTTMEGRDPTTNESIISPIRLGNDAESDQPQRSVGLAALVARFFRGSAAEPEKNTIDTEFTDFDAGLRSEYDRIHPKY